MAVSYGRNGGDRVGRASEFTQDAFNAYSVTRALLYSRCDAKNNGYDMIFPLGGRGLVATGAACDRDGQRVFAGMRIPASKFKTRRRPSKCSSNAQTPSTTTAVPDTVHLSVCRQRRQRPGHVVLDFTPSPRRRNKHESPSFGRLSGDVVGVAAPARRAVVRHDSSAVWSSARAPADATPPGRPSSPKYDRYRDSSSASRRNVKNVERLGDTVRRFAATHENLTEDGRRARTVCPTCVRTRPSRASVFFSTSVPRTRGNPRPTAAREQKSPSSSRAPWQYLPYKYLDAPSYTGSVSCHDHIVIVFFFFYIHIYV